MRNLIKQVRSHPDRFLFGGATLALTMGSTFLLTVWEVGVPLLVLAGVLAYFGLRIHESRQKLETALVDQAKHATSELASVRSRLASASSQGDEAVLSLIEALASLCALGETERLSAYWKSNGGWLRMARAAPNLEFRYSGREFIPEGQGVIDRAYRQGRFTIPDLPSFEDEPDAYLGEQKALGVNKGLSRSFAMKSQCYAAYALASDRDVGREYVIVFESLDPKGLDDDSILKVLDRELMRAVRETLLLKNLLRE